ncbi:hypothetical protein F751_5253 [Auxenochlorella protothecoides]|uniref:Glycosyltransferase 61 catalytic domain-containing protein n=1 Tax=Auxenochlorella protothecoides TaxID=3075 RepID=A0A087SQY8_AUXPR|nr:hypothetical protein F751_5253 [Auxenochlorella protothecoides]KFM28142.1 hypothetical protein F751_5253 [Auxenochlorella protothecoides]
MLPSEWIGGPACYLIPFHLGSCQDILATPLAPPPPAAATLLEAAATHTAATTAAAAEHLETLANAGLGSGGLQQAAGHQSEAGQALAELAAANQASSILAANAAASPPPPDAQRTPAPRLPRFYDKPLYTDKLRYDPNPPKVDRKALEHKLTREQAYNRTEFMGHRIYQGAEEPEEPLQLKYSSHEVLAEGSGCIGVVYEHRVCTFYDLVLWAGRMHYISPDPEAARASIPDVQLTYIASDPFRLGTNLTSRLLVTSPDNLTALLAADGGDEWGTVPKMEVEQSLLINLAYWNNYGHLLGELGPVVHNTMCTYMGLCTHQQVAGTDLQLWLYNELPTVETTMPAAAQQELWPCFSRYPLLRLLDGRLNHTAVVLRRAVAGVGSTCRAFPWCRPRYNRMPPLPGIVRGWKERMHRCLGLPLDRVSNHTHPRIVFINRPLGHGRAFINMEETVQRLQVSRVATLEDESLRSQAAKYAASDIVVQMHGAALGNVFFMPRGAVYVDVVPELNEDKHAWAYFMLKDYAALGINPIALPPQRVELMEYTINKTMRGHLNTLTKTQRRALFEDHRCPEPGTVFWDVYSICVIEWFMKRSNCYLDYADLKPAIDQAVNHMQLWRHKLDSAYTINAYDLTDLQPDRDLLDLI